MKWGVRRFRSKKGTLTKLGKMRYGKKKEKVPSMEELLASRDPDVIYKYRAMYSDRELQQRLNRLNTEETIRQKTSAARRRNLVKNGLKWGVRAAAVAGPAALGAYNIVKHRKNNPDWEQQFGRAAWDTFTKLASGKKKK